MGQGRKASNHHWNEATTLVQLIQAHALPWVNQSSEGAYPWISHLCWGKQDVKIKARKVASENKQWDYITKEDVSFPTVLAEAVMLTCVIDALEDQEIAVIDIPNAFVQNVVKDEEHCMIIYIWRPLVDILVSLAPDLYGPYVSTNKAGQKVLLVQCLNAVHGTMAAELLYYKKFVKSLTKQGYKIILYNGCMANKEVKEKQIRVCFHIDDCKISCKSSAVIDDTRYYCLA